MRYIFSIALRRRPTPAAPTNAEIQSQEDLEMVRLERLMLSVKTICYAGVLVAGGAVLASGEAQQTPAKAQAPSPPAESKSAAGDLVKRLAGAWKAPQYKMERTTELDVQVFGPHASDVRTVDLTLQPSGEGVLKIQKSVVGQKGKVYAPSVIEAKLMLGAVQTTITGRLQPSVTVTQAEERYLDGTGDKWSREGARVTIISDESASEIDLRYDGPNGQDSFATPMTRRLQK